MRKYEQQWKGWRTGGTITDNKVKEKLRMKMEKQQEEEEQRLVFASVK